MSESNGYVGRGKFLSQTKRRYDEFEVEGDDGPMKVRLRSLSEWEKSNYEAAALSRKGGLTKDKLIDAKARMLVLCMVDGDGNPLFTDRDLAQIKLIDGKITGAIYDRAIVHIGSQEGEIESIVKNSESVPVDSSP